jgi:hypothetical protein
MMVQVERIDKCQCDKKIKHGAMTRDGDNEEMRHMNQHEKLFVLVHTKPIFVVLLFLLLFDSIIVHAPKCKHQ